MLHKYGNHSLKFDLLSDKYRDECIELQCATYGCENSANYFTPIPQVTSKDFYNHACINIDRGINNGISFVILDDDNTVSGVQMAFDSNDTPYSLYPNKTVKNKMLNDILSAFMD